MPESFHKEAVVRQEQAVHIGILQEQVRSLMAGQAEQKIVNKEQSAQLAEILEKLSEAKGGWRTLMWLGGAAATLSGVVGVWVGMLTGRH